ncbi:MAG: DUF885 domain-containing protein [Acidimicrobiales bacterium]
MPDSATLLQAWLDTELDRDPVTASLLGVEGHDDRMGDFSAARWESQPATDQHWAGRLDALDLPALPLADRVDVTLVLSQLAGRSITQGWVAWRRDPSVYLNPCLQGTFGLFLNRLRPEVELVAAVESRLRQVPAVLAEARANLDADLAPALLVRRALRSCRAGVAYFRDLLPSEVADVSIRGDLANAGEVAAVALEDFAAFLDALAERARGDWALGESRYSALLRERELLGYGAAEVHQRGLAAWAELDGEMDRLAARVDPDGGGWAPVVAELAKDHPASPEAMLSAYQTKCDEARRFLVDRQLVSFTDGERCLVEPSPVFQRPVIAVASYSAPPPFSTSVTGHFFVPYPPEGESPDDLDQRLSDNSFHMIPTISVHEAYPGHYWQLTWSAANPRPVRKALRTPYFVEGWALYVEAMMREQGFFTDPRDELCHLGARIFRAARMVVDTALHTGEMTVEAAVDHMVSHAGLTPAVARAEVDRYCAWPTQAPSYLTGALEIERLRRRWMAEGRGDLRAFHDAAGASPGLPLALAELELFGTVGSAGG